MKLNGYKTITFLEALSSELILLIKSYLPDVEQSNYLMCNKLIEY